MSQASVSSLPPAALELAGRMFDAARQGNLELLQQAIVAGLPKNLTNDKGDSLIMLAAYHGNAEVVQYLLSQGADPNRLNERLQSPLAGAVFKSEDKIVQLLVEGGADPDWGTPTALQASEMFRKTEYQSLFQNAPGRGSMQGEQVESSSHEATTNGAPEASATMNGGTNGTH